MSGSFDTDFITDASESVTASTRTSIDVSKATLGVVDIVIIICYIVATFCVGIWVSIVAITK